MVLQPVQGGQLIEVNGTIVVTLVAAGSAAAAAGVPTGAVVLAVAGRPLLPAEGAAGLHNAMQVAATRCPAAPSCHLRPEVGWLTDQPSAWLQMVADQGQVDFTFALPLRPQPDDEVVAETLAVPAAAGAGNWAGAGTAATGIGAAPLWSGQQALAAGAARRRAVAAILQATAWERDATGMPGMVVWLEWSAGGRRAGDVADDGPVAQGYRHAALQLQDALSQAFGGHGWLATVEGQPAVPLVELAPELLTEGLPAKPASGDTSPQRRMPGSPQRSMSPSASFSSAGAAAAHTAAAEHSYEHGANSVTGLFSDLRSDSPADGLNLSRDKGDWVRERARPPLAHPAPLDESALRYHFVAHRLRGAHVGMDHPRGQHATGASEGAYAEQGDGLGRRGVGARAVVAFPVRLPAAVEAGGAPAARPGLDRGGWFTAAGCCPLKHRHN